MIWYGSSYAVGGCEGVDEFSDHETDEEEYTADDGNPDGDADCAD